MWLREPQTQGAGNTQRLIPLFFDSRTGDPSPSERDVSLDCPEPRACTERRPDCSQPHLRHRSPGNPQNHSDPLSSILHQTYMGVEPRSRCMPPEPDRTLSTGAACTPATPLTGVQVPFQPDSGRRFQAVSVSNSRPASPLVGRRAGRSELPLPTHSSFDPVGGTRSVRSAVLSPAWSAWPCTHPEIASRRQTTGSAPHRQSSTSRRNHPEFPTLFHFPPVFGTTRFLQSNRPDDDTTSA